MASVIFTFEPFFQRSFPCFRKLHAEKFVKYTMMAQFNNGNGSGSGNRMPLLREVDPSPVSGRHPVAAASAAAAAGAAMDALVGGGAEVDVTNYHPIPPQSQLVDDYFVDEDLIFDMPNVLVNMAEGMLLSPPRLYIAGDETSAGNIGDQYLWSYP
ncbi:hypothetical protein RJ640_030954 [Escallonia rubra]|uniref:Uncharacterized protein n=1 Tax=Escallonia rubra TaxID=112253 RepID=A0AA88QPR1_9ASTE|nr:hypothetical protein RJ640_030954 [Escallonia rubra]